MKLNKNQHNYFIKSREKLGNISLTNYKNLVSQIDSEKSIEHDDNISKQYVLLQGDYVEIKYNRYKDITKITPINNFTRQLIRYRNSVDIYKGDNTFYTYLMNLYRHTKKRLKERFDIDIEYDDYKEIQSMLDIDKAEVTAKGGYKQVLFYKMKRICFIFDESKNIHTAYNNIKKEHVDVIYLHLKNRYLDLFNKELTYYDYVGMRKAIAGGSAKKEKTKIIYFKGDIIDVDIIESDIIRDIKKVEDELLLSVLQAKLDRENIYRRKELNFYNYDNR